MRKIKPIKEKIFVENSQIEQLFQEWEQCDSITKRVMYHTSSRLKEKYHYLKVAFYEECLLISYVECKIFVAPKSEFIQKKCKAFIKIFFKSGKVFHSSFENVKYAIYDCRYKWKKRNVLKFLGVDFLEKKDFVYISNVTIFKKLFLKKITNSRALFKEYFCSRFGKIDKFPLKLAKELLEDRKKYSFVSDDFFRVLRTSKNAHITINNLRKIKDYPHLKDLSKQANLLKEKVNYNRSFNALDEIHQNFSKRIMQIRIAEGSLFTKKIYKCDLPLLYNLYPLQTEKDFFEEGQTQRHCIYTYYQKALSRDSSTLWMYFSYRKEKILASMEVIINFRKKSYEIEQLLGKFNKPLDDELYDEIIRNFECYFQDVLRSKLKEI